MWRTDHFLLSLLNQRLASPALDVVMVLATTVGLALVLVIALADMGRDRRRGLVWLGALGATFGLTMVLQFWVGRGRPEPEEVRLVFAMPEFLSFPSGHAALTFCAATLLGLARRRAWVWGAALAWAALVVTSRVYLGHHYPTDVVCGALLGSSVGAACHGLWLQQSVPLERRLRWLVWPQAAMMLLISALAYLNLIPFSMSSIPYADKVMHFLLFGLMAFWLHIWLGGRCLALGPLRVPLAVIIVLAIALPEELAQGLSSLRAVEGLDLLSDLTGSLAFVWLASRLLARLRAAGEQAPAS